MISRARAIAILAVLSIDPAWSAPPVSPGPTGSPNPVSTPGVPGALGAMDARRLERELSQLRQSAPSPQRHAEEAKILFFLGRVASEEGEKARRFEEGVRVGEEARRAAPKLPQAVYWWGANLGAQADLDHNLSSLAKVRKLEKALLELRTTDPELEHAGPDRALGRLYQKAPSVVSIGSSKKAGEHLREALRRFPGFPGNLAYLSDFLLDQGERAEARALAQRVLDSPELAKHPVEALEWTDLARNVERKTRP